MAEWHVRGIGLVAVAGIAWAALGCGGLTGGHEDAQYRESIHRMRAISRGIQLYASDYDDIFPSGTWMDGVLPYHNDERNYVSPMFDGQAGKYGFALNVAAAAQSSSQVDGQVPLLFDSVVTGWNAVADLGTLPEPPRYGGKNTIALADGTVLDDDYVDPPPTQLETSIIRMKQQGVAFHMYVNDNDETFPSGAWMDAVMPYVKDPAIFRSPAFNDPQVYGYAMSSSLFGVRMETLAEPAKVPLTFDSTNVLWNASATIDTLPVPGRYDGKNTITFADGHAEER